MTMKFVRDFYGVPAYRGGLVTVDGRRGRITSADSSIFVRFEDGESRVPCHPKWRVEYHECHEAVVRDDVDDPCGHFAVGFQYDPEFGDSEPPYPVCNQHNPSPYIQEGWSTDR